MAATPNPENSSSENAGDASSSDAKKKGKTTSALPLNPLQYRAVRFVSFMLEDSKHEITPVDFLKEAVARHLAFYQAKRGIEFPNKMLSELIKMELIPSKATPEE